MPKGGPLAFLNKKTWHPGRIQNQEKVWLKEQEAAKEQQKLEDLKKQIEEERAREELDALAQAAGVKKREEKLNWMYQGGVGAKFEANQRTQDASTAKISVEKTTDEPVPGDKKILPSFYQKDDPSSANEIWQRLHGDPLMIMKQQELQARRSIVSNPVKMDAIKRKINEKNDEERRRRKERKHHERRRERERGREDRQERHKRRKNRSRDRTDDRKRSSDVDRRDRTDDRKRSSDVDRRDRTDDRKRSSDTHRNNYQQTRHSDDGPSRYGISFGAAAPSEVRNMDRSQVIEENRKRLEDAAKRKDIEQKAAREQKDRRSHRTGTLTEEEKRRRLAEMTDAARHVDTMRMKRVSEYESRANREDSEYLSEHRSTSRDFLAQEARSRLDRRS